MLYHVLIETLWNVKKDRQVIFMDADFSINRNIVECKDRAYVSKSPQSIVLIETLWNVKKGWLGQPFIDEAVLIETLWNVKSI